MSQKRSGFLLAVAAILPVAGVLGTAAYADDSMANDPNAWPMYSRGYDNASVHGYDYSKKMRAIGKKEKIWDDKRLDTYLTNPRQVLHGVKMFFAVPDAKDRADVIAYLNTLK